MLNDRSVSFELKKAVVAFLEGHLPVPVDTKWNGFDCTATNLEAMQKIAAEMEGRMLYNNAPAKNYTYSHEDCERYDHLMSVLTAIAEERPVRKQSLKILQDAPAVFTPFIKYCEAFQAEATAFYSRTPEKIEATPENVARWKKVAHSILNDEKKRVAKSMGEYIETQLPKTAYKELLHGNITSFQESLNARCASFKKAMLTKGEFLGGLVQLLKHLRDKSAAIGIQTELDNLFSSEERGR